MSREEDFAARMLADTTLMQTLTGGVFTSGTVGINGITRDVAPTAFDANGYLEPCALVRQRGNVPDGNVRDGMAQTTSAIQVVEIYVYEDTGYTNIDAALARMYVLFEGYAFSDSFPVELSNVIDRQRDTGALNGASLARQDWAVYSVIGD
jgi:hypothetical protein